MARHWGNTVSDSDLFNVSGETGNDGVGTASVSNPNGYGKILNVAGYAPALVLSETDTGKDFTIGVNGNELRIFDETTTRVSLSSSGNFGIGTATPTQPLTVTGADSIGIDDYVLHNGDGNTKFGFNGTDSFKVRTGGGDRFVIGNDNSYFNTKLGIGTSSPSHKLTVAGTTSHETVRVLTTTGNANLRVSTNNSDFAIIGQGGSNRLDIYDNNASATRLSIDSSGNLLVGKTSSSTGVAGSRFSANGFANVTRDGAECINFNRLTSDGTIIDLRKDSVTVGTIGANAGVMTLASPNGNKHYVSNSALFPSANNIIDLGTSSQGYKDLYLSGTVNIGSTTSVYEGTGGDAFFKNTNSGADLFLDTGRRIRFTANGSERARFDSAGNLLVGTTDSSLYNNTTGVGVAIHDNHIQVARSGGVPLYLNRQTSDGTIAEFRKNGSTVGSIGTTGGDLLIGTDDCAIRFSDGADQIRVCTTAGTNRTRAIDLGFTDSRFKSLYLGGKIDLNTGSSSVDATLFFNNSNKNGWIGIPQWDNSSLRAYAPSPVSGNTNEPAFKYGSGAWSFWTDFNNTSGSGSTSPSLFISTGGSVNIGRGNLQMNSTTVIDSSRNLTNIGTVSSGDIATTGIDCSGQITSGSIEAEHTKSSTTNPIINIVNGSSSNEGYYAQFTRSGGTVAGVIGRKSQTESNIYIATSDVGLKMESYITYKAVVPCNTDGTDVDNAIDLGNSSTRFDDIYATNGTIQTSDANEKQDIQELSDAEQKVAIRCKGLIRRYKFNSAVEEKGDDARYHFGIIAQDLKDAFEAEGLDAGAYGMFISETWTNDEGQEQTRLGVRYNELLAFIIATL